MVAASKLDPLENTALGIAAGSIEVTLLQPMLYCKNATQQGLSFTINPRVLYRGLSTSILNMSILTGLQFPLTGAVQSVITAGSPRQLSPSETVSSAFLGGALSGVACAPMELVMIQQQRFGSSLCSTPGTIVRERTMLTGSRIGGVTDLLRGLATSCGREGVFCAGYLGLSPTIKQWGMDAGYGAAASTVLGAVCSGVIASTLSHPMDTIKTCMQGDIQVHTLSQCAS